MFVIFFVTVLAALAVFYYKNKKEHEKNWRHVMAIPGPKAYPIVGTNYQLFSPESLFDINRKRALEYYPIYKLWTFNYYQTVIVVSPEDMELILNNTKHNSKSHFYSFLHSWLGTGLLTSDGSKWHKRRKMLTPAFHFSILQEFTEILNAEAQMLVKNLKQLCHQPYVDVVKPITEFTLYSIGETSLGVPLREDPNCTEYKQAVYDFGENFVYRVVRPWLYSPSLYKLTQASKSNDKTVKLLHDFSTNVIKERKKALGRDASYSERKRLALLDLMLKAKNNGADINDEDIRQELDTFIFEGHDTTSVSLCYTLMALANEQKIQEELYKEIISVLDETGSPSYKDLGELKFMERCIKESLRLYPSVPGFSRVAGEDIKTKSGYTIPKGCNINLHVYDMHRSPKIWEDPEKFDPDRFLPDNISKRHPFSYIPFSAGSRNCIGQKFAMLELKTALAGILKNFKLEPYDRPEHMKYKADLVLRPGNEIRVTFVPRN